MKPQTMFRHVILAMLPLGFLGVMVFAPLWAMLMYDDSAWLWREVLSDPYYRWRIEWTAFQAACTVVLTTLLGVPTAWALARLDFTGRTSILRALMLPFVMPTLVAGMGVLALFGDQGILWRGWADTPYLLFYGNVFFNLPVMIRAAHHGLLAVPANRLAAAQVLGANEWQRFWQVEFWVMKNHLAGGRVWFFCIVFRDLVWRCCLGAASCHGGSGNLSTDCLRIGYATRGGVGVVRVGNYRFGGGDVCVVEPTPPQRSHSNQAA